MKVFLDIEQYFGGFRWQVDEGVVPDEREISTAIREYVKEARVRLQAWHEEGASGRKINEANSDCIDRLIRRLFQMAEEEYYSDDSNFLKRIAVVAVGGYGRRELSIHSDIDLLILHRGEIDEYVKKLAERLPVRLWDGNLVVGSALRTIDESLEIAREDMTARTAILDGRYLVGDPDLFHEFMDTVRKEFRSNDQEFIATLRGSLEERHEKFGESLFRLQPNLKEGVGGLRDYHLALWVALTRHSSLSIRGLIDLLDYGVLSELEWQEFREALRFVWRIRNTLHFMSKRKNDQLNFDLQERIAEELGYAAEEDDERGSLPVERFMQAYYRHARVIQQSSMVIIDQCTVHTENGSAPVVELEEGFVLRGDEIDIPHDTLLRDRPLRFLLIFEIAARENVALSRNAQRTIRENLHLLDDSLSVAPEAAASFLRLLQGKQNVFLTMMTMNDLGVLAHFLPEWEHVVCLWQHVNYHTYTVDVHSIYLVGELERLWRGSYSQLLPEFSELIHGVDDLPVLYLGCLFHDVGKGMGGDHAEKGTEIAETVCTRFGLSEEQVGRVCFLVRHHLQMSHIARRRDLSDPKLIAFFAQLVGDFTNLRNLYLLTFADFRGSSPKAWTPWSAGLLRELFHRTAQVLETGELDASVAAKKLAARAERLRDSVCAQLVGMGVDEERIAEFCDAMPQRYFLSHTSWQIARHGMVMIGFRPERVINVGIREMRGDFTEFIICAENSLGLYSKIAGCLTLSGINILGSHIHTTHTGLALEVYRVTTPEGGPEEKRRAWRALQELVIDVLTGKRKMSDIPRPRMIASKMPLRRIPPTVRISNSESDFYTIVDISADDRLGLLYDLTRKITELSIEIHLSKASTRLDQVADTFYLKTSDGRRVTDPDVLKELHDGLIEVGGRDG